MVAERQGAISNDLARLVALARDQQHIALLQMIDRRPNGFGAIADLLRTGTGGENSGADRRRIFAARIVVGDDDAVRVLRGDLAHQRTLAGIAVATGAEHHHKLAFDIGP